MNAEPSPKSISAHPAPTQPSFRKAVLEFHRTICEHATSVAEIKAALYVFDNTVGFQEFDRPKKITLDEFQHGRKRKDGSRLDGGCGITHRTNLVTGIKLAEKHGLFYTIVDASDAARIEKLYAPRLTLPSKPAPQEYRIGTAVSSIQGCRFGTPDPTVSEKSVLAGGADSALQECFIGTSEVPNRHLRGAESALRSEKVPVVSILEKVPEEREDVAPDGAEVVQGKLISGYTDPKQRAIRLLPSPTSHSQLPSIAPSRERLHEADAKENPARGLVDEQRRLIDELQQKASDANWRMMSAGPEDKHRLRNLCDDAREAVEKAREELARMEGEEESEEDAPPAALVVTPEVAPPQSIYQVLLSLFYDAAHMNAGDKEEAAIIAGKIEKRGYKPEDIPPRYRGWRQRYEGLKRASIWHFEKHIAVVAGVM